jgi:hypothetical protein
VREGRYPRTRAPRQIAPLEAQLDSVYAANGSGAVTPAAVRPALAQAAADELGTITAVLMDAATNMTRPVWTTPAQVEEPAKPSLPESVTGIEAMSWQDMQYLAATLLVDELLTVQRDGGQALLRQRVGALSDGERRALREALLEPERA